LLDQNKAVVNPVSDPNWEGIGPDKEFEAKDIVLTNVGDMRPSSLGILPVKEF